MAYLYNPNGRRIAVTELLNLLQASLKPILEPEGTRVGVTTTAASRLEGLRARPKASTLFLWFGGYVSTQQHGLVRARVCFDLALPRGVSEKESDTESVTHGPTLELIPSLLALIAAIRFQGCEVAPPEIEYSEWISNPLSLMITGHRISVLFPMALENTAAPLVIACPPA